MQGLAVLGLVLMACLLALPCSSQLVSEQQFRCMFPRVSAAKVSSWLPSLNAALQTYSINTVARVQMFLAQTGHETDSYNTFSEYVNSAGTNAWCGRYDGGCRFRGRGAIQLTHRYNYARAGRELGVDFVSNPDVVATPRYAFTVGGLFWKWNNLNACSDSRDLNTCTRKINGGTNGMADRQNKYASAKRCITSLGSGSRPSPNTPPSSPTTPPPPSPTTPGVTSCNVPGVGSGTCRTTASGCGGTFYRGFCPGASNIRCCVVPRLRAVAEGQTDYSSPASEASQLSPVTTAVIAIGAAIVAVAIAVVIGYFVYSKKQQDAIAEKP